MTPNLEELDAPGTITLRGKQYAVKPIDGYGMQLLHSVPDSDRFGQIKAAYKVAALCLGITFDEAFGTEEVRGFSEHEIAEVMTVAQSQARKVEAQASPNSEPAGEREEPKMSLAG